MSQNVDSRKTVEPSRLDSRLERLAALSGTDEGFFVLALHSFVESFVTEYDTLLRYESRFPELLWQFGELLKQRFNLPGETIRPLVRIGKEHNLTNRVRHNFARLDREEAVAAIHNFLSFCRICRIDGPALSKFRDSLKLWEEKTSPLERSRELQSMKLQLVLAQRENAELVQKMEGLAADQQRVGELNLQIRRLATELEQERLRSSSKTERVDRLRKDLNDLNLQKQELLKSMERYHDLEQYVEYLDRFTLYTRTRLDYERTVMKLAPEQQEIVDGIDLSHDFLIRGGAGTGKTLVLLHALARTREALSGELGLEPRGRIVLLTFTNTLVKYNRYLAEIMGGGDTATMIQTADSFFLARLKAIDPRYWVDYGAMERLSRELNCTDFLSSEELATEIEELLFGNGVSREEYVDNRLARRGMRQPLSAAQRAQVWAIRERMIEDMECRGALSQSYSRLKIIEHLENGRGNSDSGIDYIFLDESQDLSAMDLKALKLMARRAVMMAGDTDQSIYGVGSPYKRAGLGIVGRSRILHTNFRNTCPIHELAESYRQRSGEGRYDAESAPAAFREGPVPELYLSPLVEGLRGLLLARVALFIDKLGYDPENITILAPAKAELASISALLSSRGYEAANIRDEKFSFRQERVIRLSTLHSSKGLDFPVVLLYMVGLNRSKQYDEREADKLLRNLIYVAMTRAMDNLNVFVPDSPQEPALRDLVSVFGEYQERQEAAAACHRQTNPEGLAEG